jgi:hypothetical protein
MRSLASMPPRYTVHPVHMRSLASMPPRYTVHPVHKKGEAKASPKNLRIGGQLTQNV